MQDKIETLAQKSLGIQKITVILEDAYFPFRDPSEVKQFDEDNPIPVCDITPKIPAHLEQIQDTEMFSLFIEKYRGYPIEIFIQDERNFESTVHYSIVAPTRDGNHSASTWFHINSCNDEMSVPYNLSCNDRQNRDIVHTRYKNEIIASLESDEFCKIQMEPWREDLHKYSKQISQQVRKHLENLETIADQPDNYEPMMEFHNEMQRFDLLGDIINEAMKGKTEESRLSEMIKQYNDSFGELPSDLVKLIDAAKESVI